MGPGRLGKARGNPADEPRSVAFGLMPDKPEHIAALHVVEQFDMYYEVGKMTT